MKKANKRLQLHRNNRLRELSKRLDQGDRGLNEGTVLGGMSDEFVLGLTQISHTAALIKGAVNIPHGYLGADIFRGIDKKLLCSGVSIDQPTVENKTNCILFKENTNIFNTSSMVKIRQLSHLQNTIILSQNTQTQTLPQRTRSAAQIAS